MYTTIAKTFLLLSSAWALYTLWIVPYQNGLLTALLDLQKPGTYLPGSQILPVRHCYTGVKVIDNQVVTIVGFFWTALDGSRADVSLMFLETVTQAVTTWTLVTIESLRMGNKGKWAITSITIVGLLMQNLGFGLVIPLWMCLHLAYSPTLEASSSASLLSSSNPLPLLTLPLSNILGFFVPNVLMTLSTAHPLSPTNSTKQLYTALAQLWPVFLSGFQLVLPIAISAVTPGINALTEHDKKVKSLAYMRRIYPFILISATAAHLVAVGIPLLAYFFPNLFSPVYLHQLQFSDIFVLRSPLPPVLRITDVADGVLAHIQWDLLIGSLAALVWAVTLRLQAQARGFWAYEWLEGLVKITALVCVSGPAGAAVALVWERDELVFGRDFEREKESKNR